MKKRGKGEERGSVAKRYIIVANSSVADHKKHPGIAGMNIIEYPHQRTASLKTLRAVTLHPELRELYSPR